MTIAVDFFAFLNFDRLGSIDCEAEHVTSHIDLLMDHIIDVALDFVRLLLDWHARLELGHPKNLDTIGEAEISNDLRCFIVDEDLSFVKITGRPGHAGCAEKHFGLEGPLHEVSSRCYVLAKKLI